MAINKEAYKALEAIVGPEYISDDPAVCEGYRSGPGGYEAGCGYERVMTKIPGTVILPRTTEDVQKIVKVCNRYKVPYVPYSTGFYGPRSHCHVESELLVDLKRLNDFEIDEKHFYAVVGTGVVYSPLQEEAMKRGAYVIIGGGGQMVVDGEIENRQYRRAGDLKSLLLPGEFCGQPIRGGTTYDVKPGDWLAIPPNAPHWQLPKPGEGMSYLLLKVNVGLYPGSIAR